MYEKITDDFVATGERESIRTFGDVAGEVVVIDVETSELGILEELVWNVARQMIGSDIEDVDA